MRPSPRPSSLRILAALGAFAALGCTGNIDDPNARGGVRKIEVRGGRITGERTPTGRDYGPQMNFNQLNLDSDGAFTVANQEAEKRGIPFDRLDYTLSSGVGRGAPLWTIELFEGKSGRVGTLRIAADSGTRRT